MCVCNTHVHYTVCMCNSGHCISVVHVVCTLHVCVWTYRIMLRIICVMYKMSVFTMCPCITYYMYSVYMGVRKLCTKMCSLCMESFKVLCVVYVCTVCHCMGLYPRVSVDGAPPAQFQIFKKLSQEPVATAIPSSVTPRQLTRLSWPASTPEMIGESGVGSGQSGQVRCILRAKW